MLKINILFLTKRLPVGIATLSTLVAFGSPVEARADVPCREYSGHVSVEGRLGTERSIGETALFAPIACSNDKLLFGDLRYKTDDDNNHEGNAGLGFRSLREKGVVGGYAYFDRRRSGATDKLHSQITVGAEWLVEDWEVRANAYVPITDEKYVSVGPARGTAISDPYLSGSGIYIEQAGGHSFKETPLYGGDIEGGFKLPDTNVWLHMTAFSFGADDAESVNGGRVRASWNVTDNLTLFAEGQHDTVRERQGWVGVRLSVPFGGPGQRQEGLRARMTSSPVRDIDVVTSGKVERTSPDETVPVLNTETGDPQRVIYVDNSAAGGGDGSKESPFNTLAAAHAVLQDYDTLYISRGDGTTVGMNAGLAISQRAVHVIGEGSAFVYDGTRLTTASGGTGADATVLLAAGLAPVITNTAGDGVRVTSDQVNLTGFTVDGATGDGIVVEASGATASAQDVSIDNVTSVNNRMGIYVHGANGGAVSTKIENSVTTNNSQHGIAVYDDTNDTFEVDLGGGDLGSAGNNTLASNTFEDLAVDYDGRTLSVQNNWWGHASGPDTDDPSDGIKPQIYYGAPFNNGLLAHWTFDSEWTSNSTAYDRSGNGNNGVLQGGLSLANQVNGEIRQGLSFNGTSAYIDVANSSFINTLGSGFTTVTNAWINNLSYDHPLLYNMNGAGLYPRVKIISTGGLWLQLQTNGTTRSAISANNTVPTATWLSLATTFSGANNAYQLFVDGASIRSGNFPAGPLSGGAASPMRIGRDVNSNTYLSGRVDDIRIYNRALTSTEIAEIYRMDTSSAVDTSGFLNSAP